MLIITDGFAEVSTDANAVSDTSADAIAAKVACVVSQSATGVSASASPSKPIVHRPKPFIGEDEQDCAGAISRTTDQWDFLYALSGVDPAKLGCKCQALLSKVCLCLYFSLSYHTKILYRTPNHLQHVGFKILGLGFGFSGEPDIPKP